MDGDDNLGQEPGGFRCRKFFSQRLGTHVQRERINIDKVDARTAIEAAVSGSNKAYRGGPQPIAPAQPGCEACNVQRGGGAISNHAVLRTAFLRTSILSLGNP